MNLEIAVLSGDGIGPEVIKESLKVLSAIEKKFGHQFRFTEGLVGASAIRSVFDPFPPETEKLCKDSDAVLFGAVGDPEFDKNPKAKVRPEQGLLRMRKSLGLFNNIRPVIVFDELLKFSPIREEKIKEVDFIVVRELTSGIYFGSPQGRSENGKIAYDTCIYSEKEILQCVQFAFSIAEKRRKKLTLVDKANVLATSRLWREIAQSEQERFPEIQLDFMYVDNAAMQIIVNPSQFDVIVTENMFGDILTDESSVISGSLGALPSASIGDGCSLYEPIHGSYPQAAGKNIANPLGAILSAEMMLEYSFELTEEAKIIRQAVEASIRSNKMTEDLNPTNASKTTEVGDFIRDYILNN